MTNSRYAAFHLVPSKHDDFLHHFLPSPLVGEGERGPEAVVERSETPKGGEGFSLTNAGPDDTFSLLRNVSY